MAQLIEKKEICKDHILLKIKIDKKESHPGQFANIRVSNLTEPLLRRPFSIHDHNDDTIDVIVKIVGKATSYIRKNLKDNVDIIAPLGKGFTMAPNAKSLLIGGGVGNAPLYYLAKKLKDLNNNVTFLYGAKNIDSIYFEDKFKKITDKFIITTDDGSHGEKGFVTEVAEKLSAKESFDRVYICGPKPMMINASKLFDAKIPVEVSLENYFGCGIGLCSGCAVATKSGIKRACVDGPVFIAENISEW